MQISKSLFYESTNTGFTVLHSITYIKTQLHMMTQKLPSMRHPSILQDAYTCTAAKMAHAKM